MKERNRVLIISLAMVSIIVMALFIVLLQASHISNDNIVETAPEKEYFSLADGIAKNWSHKYHVINVRVSIEKSTKNEPDVIYTYTNTSVGEIPVYCLEISIYEGGRYDTREYRWYSPNGEDKPLGNWSVDSKEAYEIMINNDKIKAFMDAYPNSKIDGGLMLSNVSGTPTWYIEMVDWGFMDDPHWAKIQIDATTGEVLYVEADLTDGSSYLICLVPLVIIISILLVILLSKSKRFTTFAATGFALFLLPALFLHIYHYSAIFTFMALVFGAVLWKGLEKYMGRDFLKSGDKEVVYGLFGLLAADYFCLIIARFLLLPYSYPTLVWSSLLIINGAVLYILLSPSEGEGTGELLKPFKN